SMVKPLERPASPAGAYLNSRPPRARSGASQPKIPQFSGRVKAIIITQQARRYGGHPGPKALLVALIARDDAAIGAAKHGSTEVVERARRRASGDLGACVGNGIPRPRPSVARAVPVITR